MRRYLVFVGLSIALSSCNFSDPFDGTYPHGGDNNESAACEEDADCSDNGTCDDGECTCNAGYVGDTCDECDEGLAPSTVDGENVCIPEGGCDDGQTPSPDDPTTCVDDLCADDPCTETGQVAGSCTMTSATAYTCECEEGFSGDLCDEGGACASEPCLNGGTCAEADDEDGFVCDCPDRFAGDVCDACEAPYDNPDGGCMDCLPGNFGPTCAQGCDTSAAGQRWWNSSWNARIAVFVTAPQNEPSPQHTRVEFTFDHAAEVMQGSAPDGTDVRVVWVDPQSNLNQEIHRVLAVDSEWNATDTTLWWRSQRRMEAGETDLYYIYLRNPAPGSTVLADPADVLRPSRGWFIDDDSNRSLYAPFTVNGGPLSVQLRQLSPTEFELYYVDQSDFPDDEITILVTDAAGQNLPMFPMTFSDNAGEPGSPSPEFQSFTSNAASLTARVSSNTATGAAAFFGAERVNLTTQDPAETRSFTREANPLGQDPTVFLTCDIQFQE